MRLERFFVVGFFVLLSGALFGQGRTIDTTYIKETPEKMILRSYISHKFTNLDYGDGVGLYQPNSGLNLGLGVTYQKFTLNVAVPVSFLNPNRQEDWPKFLDLQAHIYPNSWIVDLFGQFYRGYWIESFQGSRDDYLRRDLRVVKIGASASYLLNGDKMSFEAAFHQSAIQKKSAFSPMAGFEVYHMRISGDSLVVPEEFAIPGNYSRGDFFHVGPSAGLAGTLVFGKGFFLTGAASGNAGVGFSKAEQNKETRHVNLMTGYFVRGFAGYNGDRISINGSYVYKHLNLAKQQDVSHASNTGNYRINLVYKIHPGPKLNKTYTKFNPKNILSRLLD